MYKKLHKRLNQIINDKQEHLLSDGLIGIEKESLRVDSKGGISQFPHPSTLGSSLTNPCITTDYSEALLEFITPPLKGVPNALNFLRKIHQFVYTQLDDELLWNASMPCVVTGEESIRIAQYGNSNLGLMKTIYRRGLGYRYGKMMQVIAGVHFNYSLQLQFWPYYREVLNKQDESLQDFISDQYFGLIRNLQRYGWLIYYLFGASPAICNSFLQGLPAKLDKFDSNTSYLPYATSLRMGDIGYNNKKESEFGFKASYDSINSYTKSLKCAIETPCTEYEKIGVKVSGEYRQLNANILQIENEYYSTVRPKQPLVDNEKPTHALSKRGVQYVELRSLDLNFYEPLSVSVTQLYFLEAFMIFCMLHESPIIDRTERDIIDINENKTAHQGRDPALKLTHNSKNVSIKAWGEEILNEMYAICEILDKVCDSNCYSTALQEQMAIVLDASLAPSAKILDDMKSSKEGFFEMACRISEKHKYHFLNSELNNYDMKYFLDIVRQSIEKQQQIEASDTTSFDQFLHDYFSESLTEQAIWHEQRY